MTGYALAVTLCLLVVALLFALLRRRRIREKYAALWVILAIAVGLLGAFPRLAFWLSDVVGVQAPVNLLFATAFVVLLAVCIQISSEVSSLEEQTRTLAEEIALLRLEVRQSTELAGPAEQTPSTDAASADSTTTDGPSA
ncbi:DUF2304 domain-containing protein [Actinotalea fermentans]|uniref:DUF2304 domain-containing protein n=1 Tax=Actinotalea fermentans TaxID=43671 RepID=A0A511YST9_9CELL|nr:DUF2304 domain-containing protein [Actinotalea fermentans]KGM16675.1 hypothetical protein N867_17500 [Actinotalea fermentans ATCC 43279 = JCM 9966 = DSM 3133]GEN78271.1 hypothetical protein AFE02nite_00050 [Actinotalea fermentans]